MIRRPYHAEPRDDAMVPGELHQAFVRLAIVGGLVLYTGATTLVAPGHHSTMWFLAPILYFAWSTLLLVWANFYCRPESPRWSRIAQRIVCMVSDYGALSYGVSLGGASGAPLYPIYLWITFGNGIRYGVRYLIVSTVICLASFAWMLWLTPYWHDNLLTGVGLLVGLAVLPVYVARLLSRLTATLDALKEANDIKARFIANMSHELRTPLNGVIAVADLMSQYDLRKDLRDMLGMIQSSARTQLGLIGRVLDVSRLSAGQVAPSAEPLRLGDVLREVDHILFPQARAKGLQLWLHLDAGLAQTHIGSPEHLRQVLLNLGGNAVKFTEQGRAELRVTQVRTDIDTERVSFDVRDTGIGIAREAQMRIFRPFAQADSSVTRRYGGTGLGVSIAQELVRLMGGEIVVASEPGRGSSFSFELQLPIAPESGVTSVTEAGVVWLLGFAADDTTVHSLLSLRGFRPVAVPDITALTQGAAFGACDEGIALMVAVGSPSVDAAGIASALRADRILGRLPLIALGAGRARTDLIDAGYTALVPDRADPGLILRAVGNARALAGALPAAPTLPRADTSLTVLVADDNPTNRAVLGMVLQHAGHTVTMVEDGNQALEALAATRFDLALLDLHMPLRSGLDVVRTRRLLQPEDPVPALLLTADTTAASMALEPGVEAVLTKPIRPADLLAAMALASASRQRGRRPPQRNVSDNRPATPLRSVPLAPVLDTAVLDELCEFARDSAQLQQLCAGFMADGAAAIAAMTRAVEEARYTDLYDLAHGFKGSARSVGASALCQRLTALEKLEVWQLDVEAPRLLMLAGEELERAGVALAARLAGDRTSAESGGRP